MCGISYVFLFLPLHSCQSGRFARRQAFSTVCERPFFPASSCGVREKRSPCAPDRSTSFDPVMVVLPSNRKSSGAMDSARNRCESKPKLFVSSCKAQFTELPMKRLKTEPFMVNRLPGVDDSQNSFYPTSPLSPRPGHHCLGGPKRAKRARAVTKGGWETPSCSLTPWLPVSCKIRTPQAP